MSELGTDLYCLDDMADDLREVTGLAVLTQAIYHRLSTPRGTLVSPTDPPDPADLEYGLDITALLGLGYTPSALEQIAGIIENEVRKEDAVDSASVVVKVTTLSLAPIVRLRVAIEGSARQGPFALTLAVDAVTVAILSGGAVS